MNASCILLNGDYTYLCQIDWKKALCLSFSEKAKVLKYSDHLVHGVGKIFKVPAVMVLIKIVRNVYRNRVPFTKKNVLVRDEYTCVYCGCRKRPLTILYRYPKEGKLILIIVWPVARLVITIKAPVHRVRQACN